MQTSPLLSFKSSHFLTNLKTEIENLGYEGEIVSVRDARALLAKPCPYSKVVAYHVNSVKCIDEEACCFIALRRFSVTFIKILLP